jgi:uncharacterized protein
LIGRLASLLANRLWQHPGLEYTGKIFLRITIASKTLDVLSSGRIIGEDTVVPGNNRLSSTSARGQPVAAAQDCDAWRALGAEIRRNRFGEYIAVRQWYATPELCEVDARTIDLLLQSQRGKHLNRATRACNPHSWIFLDTEATGFIGSAGNLAFLIGLAWWDSGGIQIEQLFMRDPAEEYSVLFELARRLRDRPVLVTFNGKSFDWPLLVNRAEMSRRIALPVPKAHLDFLHPAREIWKLQIGSSKLCHLEEHVLGFESLGWSRREDIDGSRVPAAYFDYVSGSAHRMESVFRHNRMDLRGLAALAVRVLQLVSADESEHSGRALETYGLSRFFGKRGRHTRARRCCESALSAGLPPEIAANARQELARYIKRELRQIQVRLRSRTRSTHRTATFDSQMRGTARE